MPEPLAPSEGWGVLHLFYRLGPGAEREAAISAVKSARVDGYQVVTVALLGHKADLCVMAAGPDLWRLRDLQGALVGAGLELVWSYVSLTEVSEYAAGLSPARKLPRLEPSLPPVEGMRAWCFYPMSKRRGEGHNWYALGYSEREALMQGHGAVGRGFSGRVAQLITGSAGLDDWEWGVTLFAVHPDDLKDVVYTMRFDEASSRYAEFGPFYTGMVAELGSILGDVADVGSILGDVPDVGSILGDPPA
ncbi:MAG: chlorite dismutase family protein [Acidimicrobiales bacterium]